MRGTEQVYPIKDETAGIDLRTWMATQFMAAGSTDIRVQATPENRAKDAIAWADALISELNKTPEVAS